MKLRDVSITFLGKDGNPIAGVAHVTELSRQQAFWKGAKRSARIVGIVMGVLLPFAFMEPFLFLIWGSITFLVLVFLVGPYLHLQFATETSSFSTIHAACPHCGTEGELTPYLSTRFEKEFTVLCPTCGQTARAQRSTS